MISRSRRAELLISRVHETGSYRCAGCAEKACAGDANELSTIIFFVENGGLEFPQ